MVGVRHGLACSLFIALSACNDAVPRAEARDIALRYERSIPADNAEHDSTLLTPSDLEITSENAIVVADDVGPTLRVLDYDGALIRVIGRSGAGPAELRSIAGLAVSPDGSLYVVSDTRNRRLTVFDQTGAVRAETPVANGRTGAVELDLDGRLHFDRRGPFSGARAPGEPTIVVLSTAGESLYTYGSYEPVDDPFGDALLNEVRFARSATGVWVLWPYQGKLRHYSAGASSPSDSILLPPPIGRPAAGPFTETDPNNSNAVAVVRMPVADDLAVDQTGQVYVSVLQTPPGAPMHTDILVFSITRSRLASITLAAPSRRIAVSDGLLYALRDPHITGESRIDIYSIVVQ